MVLHLTKLVFVIRARIERGKISMTYEKISQEDWHNWLDKAMTNWCEVNGDDELPENMTVGKVSAHLADVIMQCIEQQNCPFTYQEMCYRVLQLQIYYMLQLERRMTKPRVEVIAVDITKNNDFLTALADAISESEK
jgi:hypothetical protein